MNTDLFSAERHLLVILPHPDDESFGCAGVMAMLRQQGVPVTLVCATSGQMGRHMGRPPFATRETLPALRRQELAAALKALQVEDLRLLGLWDKTVEFEDAEILAGRLKDIMVGLKPSTVITFHPQYGGHPDHMALGAATVQAAAMLPPADRPRVWCIVGRPENLELDLPIVTVDIRAFETQKRAAFDAHRSQTTGWEKRIAENEHMRKRFAELFRSERFFVHPVTAAADQP